MKVADVGVGSDLYCAGRTEDGEEYIAEVFYVCVEFTNGVRMRHNQTFRSVERTQETDDEGYGMVFFKDLRVEAEAKAQRLADRVKAALEEGRVLDAAYWNEMDPVYGSPAYLGKVSEMTPEQRAE